MVDVVMCVVRYLAKDCKASKTESKGQKSGRKDQLAGTKAVTVQDNKAKEELQPTSRPPRQREELVEEALSCIFSSDSEEDIRMVRVQDRGTKPRYVEVGIQGVPASGIIDSGADTTIMGGELFKRVATSARLKKKEFKKPDKTPTPMTKSHSSYMAEWTLTLPLKAKQCTHQCISRWMHMISCYYPKEYADSWESSPTTLRCLLIKYHRIKGSQTRENEEKRILWKWRLTQGMPDQGSSH